MSREYSCQLNGTFFTASCFASSSANILRIPVFKAYCHVQLTVYWEESRYRYPTGKSYVIQSLRFQSARFWVPFWNDAVFPESRSVLLLLFFSICQNKCCFYQLSHFLYWYKLICSAQTTDVLAAWCIYELSQYCGCTFKRPKRTKRYQCTESLLGCTLQERWELFNSLHLGDKIFIEEYFHAMKVQCCCVTLFWVMLLFSLLTRPK